MADPAMPFPAQLLSYLGLVGVVAVRRVPDIMAALVLVLQLAAQDLAEDVRRFLEANWTDMVRFATARTDIEYYEWELANGHLNELLVEAVCRMKSIQLLVRHLGAPANTSRLFGVTGQLYELIEVGGEWFILLRAIAPWSEDVLMAAAQEQQSGHQNAEYLEAVDVAGPSRVRRSSCRSRETTESLKRRTIKKASRSGHLKFEVISSPLPTHVRSILTVARRAAKRLSDRARRTLVGRVRFNPVAVVTDISPLADKVPNEVRLPEDTVRQDEGDALQMVRAEEVEAQAVEVEDGGERMQNEVAEEPEMEAVGGGEGIGAEEVATAGGERVENEVAEEPEVEAVGGGEGDEVEEIAAAGNEGEQEEQVGGPEAVEEEEPVASGQQEEDREPVAEVFELQEPAFELLNDHYVCRLPGCPTPDKEFATLKGWKLHASHTRIHQQQGFCTGCGHCVVIPPQLEGHEKKIWLDAHRRERCEGASSAVLKQRRLEKRRLEALWRDASHVRLPDEDEAEIRRAQKRAYPTEEERRAGVCLAYIKHFKTTNPARLDEVAADFQLTIL